MNKLMVITVAALATLGTLSAQTNKPAPKPAVTKPTEVQEPKPAPKPAVTAPVEAQEFKPAAKAGATSFNFTFAGLGAFGIGPAGVNGGISLSFFLSNDAALRLGLQGILNSSTQPWNDNSGNATNPGTDGTTSSFGLGVGADYLMYASSITPRVKPYLGAGVYVTMNSSSVKPAISDAAGTATVTETKNGNGNEGLSFGLAGIAGAEFFLYPEISVSAEYQLTLFSLTSKSDRVVSYKGSPSVTTKQGSATQILGFKTFGATLHIYF
jgi:opacity protein-like surface antigen